MKRKVLSVLLSAALAATLMTGCGQATSEPAAEAAPAEEAPAAE